MKASLLSSVALIALLVACGPGTPGNSKTPVSPSSANSHKDRLDVVKRASTVAIPDAIIDANLFTGRIHGDESSSFGCVSYSKVFFSKHDWSKLKMNAESGGPVRPMLEQARLHMKELAACGFIPLRSCGYSSGKASAHQGERTCIKVRASHEHARGGSESVKSGSYSASSSGGGSNEYEYDLSAPRLIHWCLYAVPTAGASLFIRMEYDQTDKTLSVDWCYSDRTVIGHSYPGGTGALTEEIVPR